MKLKEFKKYIDATAKKAGKCDVDIEIWFGEHCFDVSSIGQFGVVPDVTVSLSYRFSSPGEKPDEVKLLKKMEAARKKKEKDE